MIDLNAPKAERLQQSIDYHIAEAEMWEAYKALNSAKVR